MASKIVPKDVVGKVTKLMPSDPAGTAKSILQKVMKPWTVTGPTATPEFLESVPDANDYRKIAPATMAVRPAIPHAEPGQVFDIKYHTRDRKRSVKTTVQEMDPVALAAELQGLPPTPGSGTQYVMGKAYHMDDEPGEGYAK
ncbi:hypothetical protein M758_5G042100 [Ceratodon purpureus]|uniref:Uncharacterized protein n=1 Tax=Ceratodon purpureus TaxID=3225 RepID=A0A8T0HZ70_CERPU|nr:hypothetical protein KC19_N018800 [Ceratodon purpureus]KAG0575951.1 hypothetical protein KC19_5G043100 [Ceratodon purpureus]KAG0615451.1 hypothetical protein M758_5G042100 [Ceratodon purpureus]